MLPGQSLNGGLREFPGGPVVRTAKGPGLSPGRGPKIPQAKWCSQKKNRWAETSIFQAMRGNGVEGDIRIMHDAKT